MRRKVKRRGLIHQVRAAWRWFWAYHRQCDPNSDAYRRWLQHWIASKRWRMNDGRD